MVASRRQNVINFNEPGLTVYAVPWEYAFCGKMDRLTKPDRRPYDAADAVAYLHQCVKTNGGRAIHAQWVDEWARKYDKAVTAKVLMEVDSLYQSKYGEQGILF